MLNFGFLLSLTLLSGAPNVAASHSHRTPKICAMAAESIRDWGWRDRASNARSTPVSTIVSAVNNQLRLNSGQLMPKDVSRLKAALSSQDTCFREVATSVLAIPRHGRIPTQSVTRSLEKQSLIM